jgi:hypothetical protein
MFPIIGSTTSSIAGQSDIIEVIEGLVREYLVLL